MTNTKTAGWCGGLLGLAMLAGGAAATPTPAVLIVDSGGDFIVRLDPANGSIVQDPFIDLVEATGGASSTAIEVIQVRDELWISDQVRNVIYRYTAASTPAYLGEITGAMSNIRGMAFDPASNTVFVCNAGTDNGAPGDALLRIDVATRTIVGSSPADGPWDVIVDGGRLLVSTNNNDRVDQFSLGGVFQSVYAQPEGLNFPQQLLRGGNGDLLVCGFSSSGGTQMGVYRLDSSGAFVTRYAAPGPRGVVELGDGDLLASGGINVNRVDLPSGAVTTAFGYPGASFRFFTSVVLDPEVPACPADFNSDGFVDDTDFVLFAQSYDQFTVPPANPATDLNSDGFVDDTDFVLFAQAYDAFVCP